MRSVARSDKDYIAAQFRKCWNVDVGTHDPSKLIVRVRVLLNPDGTIIRADIVDDRRYALDNLYRMVADAARRAVYTCAPIKFPPEKYAALKDLELNFDPRDAVR